MSRPILARDHSLSITLYSFVFPSTLGNHSQVEAMSQAQPLGSDRPRNNPKSTPNLSDQII